MKPQYPKRTHHSGSAPKDCYEREAFDAIFGHRSSMFFSLIVVKTVFHHTVKNSTLFLPRKTSINTNTISKILRLQV